MTATADIPSLKLLDDKLRFLSSWTIHHANHVRLSSDGLKVGGHQASCASMTGLMTALYFHALGLAAIAYGEQRDGEDLIGHTIEARRG